MSVSSKMRRFDNPVSASVAARLAKYARERMMRVTSVEMASDRNSV
jgi:hypothetical protein